MLQLCQFSFCSWISLLMLLSVVLSISKSLFSCRDTISFLQLVLYVSSVFDISLTHVTMQSPETECGDKTKPSTKPPQSTTSLQHTCTLLYMTAAKVPWNPIVRLIFLESVRRGWQHKNFHEEVYFYLLTNKTLKNTMLYEDWMGFLYIHSQKVSRKFIFLKNRVL